MGAEQEGLPRGATEPVLDRAPVGEVEHRRARAKTEGEAEGPSVPSGRRVEEAEVLLALLLERAEAGHRRLPAEAGPILHRRDSGLAVGEEPQHLQAGERHSPSRTCGDLRFAWSSWDS